MSVLVTSKLAGSGTSHAFERETANERFLTVCGKRLESVEYTAGAPTCQKCQGRIERQEQRS